MPKVRADSGVTGEALALADVDLDVAEEVVPE